YRWLSGVYRGQDGTPEGAAKPDDPANVDYRRWHQTANEGGARYAGDSGHLGRVNPQARKQAGREDGPPATSSQQLRRSLQRLLGVQRPRDLHQAAPAEEGGDLAT